MRDIQNSNLNNIRFRFSNSRREGFALATSIRCHRTFTLFCEIESDSLIHERFFSPVVRSQPAGWPGTQVGAANVDVWLDQWEIRARDVRQKIEQDCTIPSS